MQRMTPEWDPDFLERSPMFAPLRLYGEAVRAPEWPALTDLQRALAGRDPPLRAQSGARISFVPQGRRTAVFEERYEPRIYLKGEVQLRECNWHDLLNALVWLSFPRTKAALNARHYHALLARKNAESPNRGSVQDALTLFDEGGVLVAARDRALLQSIERFEWTDLFWRNRARVMADLRFYVFGHALYEKALNPFTGITARGLLFEVAPAFLDASPGAQLAAIDALAAGRLSDAAALHSTQELAPLPILGVPGWCADNEREEYYADTEYFRPGRLR